MAASQPSAHPSSPHPSPYNPPWPHPSPQMVLPASLGPLLRARSFVLVGDPHQLPPLVTCGEAEAGGLGDSLFKRLSEAHPQVGWCWVLGVCGAVEWGRTGHQAHGACTPAGPVLRAQSPLLRLHRPLLPRPPLRTPQAVVSLPVQYRMAEDIQALPNALIYDQKLRCGSGARPVGAGCLADMPAACEPAA